MKILVTGGCGYIGSHTVVELLNNNYEVVVIDNLCNSKKEVMDKVYEITKKKVDLYIGDVRDKELLNKIFNEHDIEAVIHFAGLKAVGESVKKPLEYYQNNLDSTFSLLEVMREHNCKKIIFSSSATVYGNPEVLPLTEECKIGGTTNPYGTSKLFQEQILQDVYKADNEFGIVLLRYFNPVGAHSSGLIGENPNGIPNNLMPYIMKVANHELDHLNIFGNDYDTKDGTGVRDYIHVVDLAKGHICALKKILNENGALIYNLGTGVGYSVLDIVEAFKRVNKVDIPYQIVARRDGDIASMYADSSKALRELNWKAELNLDDMVSSSYNYIINNK